MNLSIFAERLSELMFEQQLNAPKLAAQVDCTPATINRYVAAKKMPAVQMVIRLSDVFGCTTDFLLGLENESYTHIFRKCPTFQQRLPKLCEEFHVTKAELQEFVAGSMLQIDVKTIEDDITINYTQNELDELDAIGGKRTESDKAYERQTLNQLLSCMDGFSANDGVFIFAATNDVNSLDSALLRPGRFDSRFAVSLPDTTKDRMAIINLYMKNKKLDESVSIEALAKQTLGCSPATIEAIINEAAIESVKNGGIINQKNIDDAFYRQIMDGHKKKNSERNNKEIQTVAWHEAGHALIGYLQNEEVTKISIVPTTSGAGGVTLFNHKKMGMYSKEELENHIRTLYAGRNAEILLNGETGVTTGASNDIKEATRCIKHMVTTYGMSKYGLLDLTEINVPTSELIAEYQTISKNMENSCMEMLVENRVMLETLANTLISRETLDENDLMEIFEKFTKEKEKEYEKSDIPTASDSRDLNNVVGM
jgi:SpoVK/Ycf46/Vps4 family AAA+-type ATPase